MKMIAALFCLSTVMGQQPLREGKMDSAVRVVIYEDLQCPDCAVFRKMLDDSLLPRYADKVLFEHRDFPLPKHNWAKDAAIASRHFQAIDPKLAVSWRRQILADLRKVTRDTFTAYLKAFAKERGADPDKAAAALSDAALAADVQRDYDRGVAQGIARTPTVLVNGEPFIETFTLEQISKSIEGQLAAAGVK